MALINARDLNSCQPLEAEVCIIGSGPAGSAIAERLADTRHRVIVLESGNRRFSARAQRLSRGAIIGEPYEPLDLCRVRRVGGSTGKSGWGGWCKPLSPDDFEPRAHVPESGWPIGFDELQPYYGQAYETCGFRGAELARVAGASTPPDGEVYGERSHLAPRMDFAEAWEVPPLSNNDRVRVIYNATATEVCTDETPEVADAVLFSDGRRRFRLRARLVVLATGGIENARLLLLSERVHAGGIGNRNDLVGRYFMEHPRLRWGHVSIVGDGGGMVDFDKTALNHLRGSHLPAEIVARMRNGLVLSPERRAREGLLGSRSWLEPVPNRGEGEGAQALRNAGFWILKGRRPPHLLREVAKTVRHPVDTASALVFYRGGGAQHPHSYRFNSIFEQEPQRDSRVTLGDKRDRLGLRRPRLDWRLSAMTERTFGCTQEILVSYLRRLGHAVDYEPWSRDTPNAPALGAVRHHMGTTRMSDSPATGVVDRNCLVHGMRNLYVAGSSVFPTVGNDMATLTVIALALRIADTLVEQLGRRPAAHVAAAPASGEGTQQPPNSAASH